MNNKDSNLKALACIVVYNSGYEVLHTFECLRAQSIPIDILVVDNNSEEDYSVALKTLLPDAQYITLPQNIGYTGGNNIGFDYARDHGYEYLFVVNPDVYVDADVCESMIGVINSYSGVGIVGCMEVDFYSGETRTIGGVGYNFWLSRRKWLGADDYSESPLRLVDYCQGAFFLVGSSVLKSETRLSAEIFAYADEIDFGIKLKRSGVDLLASSNIKFRHKLHNRAFRPLEGYLLQRNRLFLVLRYGNFFQKFVHIFYLVLFELPSKMFYRALQGRFLYSQAVLNGFLDGLLGRMGEGRLKKFITLSK